MIPNDEQTREREMIGHLTWLLNQCATIIPYIHQYETEGLHPVSDACANSFTTDFRALYGFLIGPKDRKARDAHRRDYAPDWTPSRTAEIKRLEDLKPFIDKHRAHVTWDRVKERSSIEKSLPPEYLQNRRLIAASYAYILSDYLNILDEFTRNLPTASDEQKLFFSASFDPRAKVNRFMGLPAPDPTPPWPLT
jgi:hypothetical protein